MNQSEIYIYLQKNKGCWFTANEVHEVSKVNLQQISIKLNKLILFKSIVRVGSGTRGDPYKYSYEGVIE